MDENHERQRHCPRCLAVTRYERRAEPWKTLGAVVTVGAYIPCLWPVSIPLWLLFIGVASLRPLRCNVCGRASWDWSGEPGYYPDVADPEGPIEYDTIRLVRRAPVGSEDELVEPITRVVRAVHSEGRRFRLIGHSPARNIHRLRTVLLPNVWKFVTTSEIQWNFGREPGDPTHEVVFRNTAQDSAVFLKVQWVQAGTESTRPGFDLTLSVQANSSPLRADRAARLDWLFTRLVRILRPDYGLVELPEPMAHHKGCPPAPAAGWLTYVAGKRTLAVPPPAVSTPLADGVKITLAPGQAPAQAADIADAVAAVDRAIAADPP